MFPLTTEAMMFAGSLVLLTLTTAHIVIATAQIRMPWDEALNGASRRRLK